jgi:hypothetical protein
MINILAQTLQPGVFNYSRDLPNTAPNHLYIVADSTKKGFEACVNFILKSQKQRLEGSPEYVFYRLRLPYNEFDLTPAEAVLHGTFDKPVTGRLRWYPADFDFAKFDFEQIILEDTEPTTTADEWPFPHQSTLRDMVGNAEFGNRLLIVPSLFTGLTVIQRAALELWTRDQTIHELAYRLFVRYDLDVATITEQLFRLPSLTNKEPLLHPALPLHFRDIYPSPQAIKQWCIDHCKGITTTIQPIDRIEFVASGGALIRTGYLEIWLDLKMDDILLEKKETIREWFDETSQGFKKRVFLRMLYLPGTKSRLYFDASLAKKREYLLELFDGDEALVEMLMLIPNHCIGRDMLEERVGPWSRSEYTEITASAIFLSQII